MQLFPVYIEHLDAALENFCDRHWPCEFVKPGGGGRCVNVRSGHGSKGHQLKDGKVLAVGGYISTSSFESLHVEFRHNVYLNLQQLLTKLNNRLVAGQREDQAAAQLHKNDVMAHLYRHVIHLEDIKRPIEAYNSHTACFCCLLEPPEHVLPCGHVLCNPCVFSYGQMKGNIVEVPCCPIEATERSFYPPFKVHIKPKSAGIRMLTLDG